MDYVLGVGGFLAIGILVSNLFRNREAVRRLVDRREELRRDLFASISRR